MTYISASDETRFFLSLAIEEQESAAYWSEIARGQFKHVTPYAHDAYIQNVVYVQQRAANYAERARDALWKAL